MQVRGGKGVDAKGRENPAVSCAEFRLPARKGRDACRDVAETNATFAKPGEKYCVGVTLYCPERKFGFLVICCRERDLPGKKASWGEVNITAKKLHHQTRAGTIRPKKRKGQKK